MKKTVHIGLLVDASRAYGRGICRGVANYAESHPEWLILAHERPELDELPVWLRRGRVDGLIAYIPNRKLHRKIAALGIPVVDVHGRCKDPQIPAIESDAAVIVSLALDFFLKSGFEHLAFCGYPSVFFSDQREAAFRAQTAGRAIYVYTSARQRRADGDLYRFEKAPLASEPGLSRWLRSLPKPVAILACNDIRGQQVINACREAGLSMPEDVCVLGVDNDEIICRLCRPTLSSIEPDVEGIGALAARLLEKQLGCGPVAAMHHVPPRQVVQRESTDTVAVRHPLVIRAARLIRDPHRAEASVDQVCEAVGVSRSTLDKLFLEHLGRPVAKEMTRIRLLRAEQLLRNTDLSLAQIAQRCGFSSATYFCRFFKRDTGITPDVFRRG